MWSWLCYCRKTKALENILDEKHKRRKVAEEETTNREREQRLQEKSKITVCNSLELVIVRGFRFV